MEFYCETLSLTDCTHELTAAILEHIFCLWPQEASCIEKLVGVISEIRQPMESTDKTMACERESNELEYTINTITTIGATNTSKGVATSTTSTT